MYFKFDCDHCGKSLKVSEEKAGRKARCPYCHQSVIVPEPEREQDDPSMDVFSQLADQQESSSDFGDSDEPAELPGSAAKEKSKPKKKRKAKVETSSKFTQAITPTATSGEQFAQSTEVSMWKTAAVGEFGSAWFYILLWIVNNIRADMYFVELFCDRGWIPYAETFLMGWSAAILLAKRHKLRRQRESMLFDVLPTDISKDIDEGNVDKFIGHIKELPTNAAESFLINRVLRGLSHFKVRGSNAEVSALLSSQSDIDANAVESSYRTIKVFIWAIPILGFIGTVMGLSAAIGQFGGAIESASGNDISQIKDTMKPMLGGLATAFDTTLIALIMSLLISFPQSALQKAEDDLINWVDEYCNENLLKRLVDGEQISEKDQSMGAVAQRIARVQQEIGKLQESHVNNLRGASEMISNHTAKVEQNLGDITGQVERAMLALIEKADGSQEHVDRHMQNSAEALRHTLEGLQTGIDGLNRVLGKLGQETIHIEMTKRGLFGKRKTTTNGG